MGFADDMKASSRALCLEWLAKLLACDDVGKLAEAVRSNHTPGLDDEDDLMGQTDRPTAEDVEIARSLVELIALAMHDPSPAKWEFIRKAAKTSSSSHLTDDILRRSAETLEAMHAAVTPRRDADGNITKPAKLELAEGVRRIAKSFGAPEDAAHDALTVDTEDVAMRLAHMACKTPGGWCGYGVGEEGAERTLELAYGAIRKALKRHPLRR